MIGGLRRIVHASVLLVPAAGLAAASMPSQAGGEPGLVSELRASGAEAMPLGTRGGLEGYFVTPAEGAGYSLYVTRDGHAVAGLLYAPDGSGITGAQIAAARADPGAGPETPEAGAAAMSAHAAPAAAHSPSGPRALFERSAAAFGFTLGESGPAVVLFGDPACPFSRAAAARLGREALAGRLRLRVVPVAVLGADAARRAAAIAAHPEPALAWFEGGGRADRPGAERIARNNALFDRWGAEAVPLIAWRMRDGTVRSRIGDVDDVGAWIEEAGLE